MSLFKVSIISKIMIFLVVATLSVAAIASDFNITQKSAEQGNAAAQNNLGTMYNEGEGVRQNKATAEEWFAKSCVNGSPEGYNNYKIFNQK